MCKKLNLKLNLKINLEFDINKYLEILDENISKILSRKNNTKLTYDILDTHKSFELKQIILKEKQKQMKIGEIWQMSIGNYKDFINLKNGHESGLDIISHSRKIAIELKNRTNTDNSSSKKTNFDKLYNFKCKNPDYTVIYANINADTEEKTLYSESLSIQHNGIIIEHHIGLSFLKFIFCENTDKIISFIKNKVNQEY